MGPLMDPAGAEGGRSPMPRRGPDPGDAHPSPPGDRKDLAGPAGHIRPQAPTASAGFQLLYHRSGGEQRDAQKSEHMDFG